MQLTDAMFDGEAEYVGYPMEDGSSGILISPMNTFGINSQSPHKEGAFAFISYLLSDAYQVHEEFTFYPFIPIKRGGAEDGAGGSGDYPKSGAGICQ